MYFIKRNSDDMWLIGHMRSACGAPTCIWGEHFEDALPFEHLDDATLMSKWIGGVSIIFRKERHQ